MRCHFIFEKRIESATKRKTFYNCSESERKKMLKIYRTCIKAQLKISILVFMFHMQREMLSFDPELEIKLHAISTAKQITFSTK